ncbi:helix-turn-helix transcriptional regulator [Patulibacter sp. S7RM1-6]
MERFDRPQLADFLRRRREALQPEDVGLGRGTRRRAPGLRREEVALLASMSTDYYARIEQGRGPQPSEPMLAALARALRLRQEERDHLFRLAGHTPPSRATRSDHVNPALLRVLDRLDAPAEVKTDLGETLAQNPLAVATFGDETRREGPGRALIHRWFLDPAGRGRHHPDDHDRLTRAYVAALRLARARRPEDERGRVLVDELLERSEEFRARWAEHDVSPRPDDALKRYVHPQVGELELHCQILMAESDAQMLLVHTAALGSEDAEKLRLLGVIGAQEFADAPAVPPAP